MSEAGAHMDGIKESGIPQTYTFVLLFGISHPLTPLNDAR